MPAFPSFPFHCFLPCHLLSQASVLPPRPPSLGPAHRLPCNLRCGTFPLLTEQFPRDIFELIDSWLSEESSFYWAASSCGLLYRFGDPHSVISPLSQPWIALVLRLHLTEGCWLTRCSDKWTIGAAALLTALSHGQYT